MDPTSCLHALSNGLLRCWGSGKTVICARDVVYDQEEAQPLCSRRGDGAWRLRKTFQGGDDDFNDSLERPWRRRPRGPLAMVMTLPIKRLLLYAVLGVVAVAMLGFRAVRIPSIDSELAVVLLDDLEAKTPRQRSSGQRDKELTSSALRSTESLMTAKRHEPSPSPKVSPVDLERLMDIYCRGPLLHAVQMTEVFADSKHFVDMPIKRNSSVFQILLEFDARHLALTEFQASKSHSHDHVVELRAFLDDHFDPPGSDLIPITPLDFQAHTLPPMIAAIQDDTLRDWAFSLHQLWKNLGRVPEQSLHSSFLHARALAKAPLKRTQNVLIVPGGRFRESYYWDSYWIVQGLLVSHMHHTARGVVNNLLEYVAEFGFVPNGGRVYYLTRSQPPMLTSMVQLVARVAHNATQIEYDASYLAAAVPILDNEYRFWMQRGPSGHTVEIERHDAVTGRTVTHVLNRYVSHADHPRPESYREDVAVATEIFGDPSDPEAPHLHGLEANKTMYYNDVIAAAESGWDFSSRWLRDPQDMRTMATSCIVPVDLNAILFKVERTLMEFHRYLGHTKRAAFYEDAAVRRARAIDAVLWSDEHQAWKDWNLETSAHSTIVSVSDYTPLWAKVVDRRDTKRLDRIVQSLQDSGLHQVGGIQTTTTFTGQQWDAPNAWPPEQDLIIEGLLEANTAASHELARSLLQTWVRTGLVAWQKTGLMFEKYNATEVGGLGVGGEYFPQFGFGWTNGVILKFLTIHQNLLLN